MTLCPCGFPNDYALCCEPYLADKKIPLSPEALMRSRYTAYSLADITYIVKTMRGKPLNGFDEAKARLWAERATWLGLNVINTRNETPDRGYVEFIARFIDGDQLKSIHEISEFHLDHGHWFYVDGSPPVKSVTSKNKPIARNSLCPCGSQKKFKNCHARSQI